MLLRDINIFDHAVFLIQFYNLRQNVGVLTKILVLSRLFNGYLMNKKMF